MYTCELQSYQRKVSNEGKIFVLNAGLTSLLERYEERYMENTRLFLNKSFSVLKKIPGCFTFLYCFNYIFLDSCL